MYISKLTHKHDQESVQKVCPIRRVSEYYDSPLELSLQFQFNDNTYFENAINYPNISTRQYYSLLYQPVDRTL